MSETVTDMNETKKLPVHVSIIMDGNGRWAKQRGLERVKGHMEGIRSVRACTEAAVEAGIRYLSLFAFSEENWNRPKEEVGTLMGLMMKAIAEEVDTMMKNGVRFVVIGNRERLSVSLNAERSSKLDNLFEIPEGFSDEVVWEDGDGKEKTLVVSEFLAEPPEVSGAVVRFTLEAKANGSLRPDVLLQHCHADANVVSITRIAQR